MSGNVLTIEGDRRHEEKFLRELGTTVRAAIEDPSTEDIVLNADSRLWVKRRGCHFQRVGTMLDFQAMMLIGTVAYMRGNLVVNAQSPILECDLPSSRAASRPSPRLWFPLPFSPFVAVRKR